jgi:hypothetical protein
VSSSISEEPVASPHQDIRHQDIRVGDALERVFEAQQLLVVRRIELLVEKVAADGWSFFATTVRTLLGTVIALAGWFVALAGWFVALAGAIDALDDYFPRDAVEIALGLIHVAAGTAIALYRRRGVLEDVR